MEIINSPNPIDEPNLIYKLQRKLKIFNESDLPNRGCNLVATSSKYGLVFVGVPTYGFAVYYLRDVVNAECTAPSRLMLTLPEPPTHLTVGCDQELLAIATANHISFYNVVNFQNENSGPASVRCGEEPRARVSAVQWNPCQPDTLAAALSDGSLLICQVKGPEVAVKKIAAKARCLCWSPKGKQLVTGNADGTLCQYKPDLTAVKSVPAPDICGGAPAEALAVHWISNYQFGVVYRNSADDSRPYVTIVNTPKAGPMLCISYEDICYSMGSSRPWYYYLHSVAQWGILMAASSNSVEVATLGTSDTTNWVQWCQSDEAKPELPLTDRKQDNYPVGLAFDTAAMHQLPWGENETLPHMPSLLVLSHTGLLVVFNVVNLRPGAPQLCEPPLPLALPPHLLLTESPVTAEAPPQPPPTAAPAPPPAAPPVETAAKSQAPSGAFAPPSSGFAAAQPSPAPLGQTQQSASIGQGEPKPPPDVVLQPQPKPTPSVQQAAQAVRSQPSAEAPPATRPVAGHKSAELRAASARATEEMTSVLVELVNGFQAELHAFLRRARDLDMQLGMSEARALAERLRETSAAHIEKECSLELLSASIAEMKLDVVKTCALIADARSEPGGGRHVEPLCARSLESVRRRLEQVQAALQQAERIVHHKWGEVYARFHRAGRRGRGEYMATPALDAVYQPLVKQQEILSRQRAVVRALQAALQEASCGATGTLLKGFDKDPLSALSRGVLAMRLERGGGAGAAGAGSAGPGGKLSAHKLDALREMLVNHKTTRIKPFNVVMERHLASMAAAHERLQRESRERGPTVLHRDGAESAREPAAQNGAPIKQEPTPRPAPLQNPEPIGRNATPTAPKDVPRGTAGTKQPPAAKVLEWANVAPASQANVLNWAQKPSVADAGNTVTITASNIASVARNLFANNEAPKFEIKSTSADIAPPKPITDKNIPTSNAGSIIVGLLQGKSNQQRNDPNMFMGQKICSPTTVPSSAATPFGGSKFSAFATKPAVSASVAASQPTFGADSKPFAFFSNQAKTSELPSAGQRSSELANAKSVETGENNDSRKADDIRSRISKDRTTNEPQTEGKSIGDKSALESSMKPEEAKSSTESKEQNAEPKQPTSEKGSFQTADSRPFSFQSPDAKSPTTPTGSIFAMPPSPNAITGSIFGVGAVTQSIKDSAPTSTASVFASPTSGAPSIFGSQATQGAAPPAPAGASPSATSIFGAPNKSAVDQGASPISSPASSIFGVPPSSSAPLFGSTSPVATTVSSIFGATSPVATTVSSVFGATTPVATTISSVFSATSPVATTVSSVFGVTTPVTTTVSSVFGATTPVATTVSSVFGATTPVATTVSSVFGATTPVVTTVSSVFGATSPVATTVSSVFGATIPVVTTVSSVFGGTSPVATTVAPVFGSTTPVAPPAAGPVASVFGATTPVATTVASVFGATPPAASSPASLFGASPAASTPASVFGASTAASTPASVFGAAAPAASTAASVFGAATTDVGNQGIGNIFGSQQFGKPAVQATQSVFASSDPSSLFGAVSISTTNASPASPGNVFANSSGGSVFGGGVFGGAGAGGGAGAASVFGGGAFGQQPASVFGASAFGAASPSQTTQASSIFGGGFSSGAGAFGSAAAPTSIFGTPEPPKPASVFGSPQQNAPAFGGGAVFGSKPVFGQSGFGAAGGGFTSAFSGGGGAAAGGGFGAPAFGGKSPGGFGAAPVFGGGAFGSTSPSKLFGGGGSPGFGAPMQQSSTFENLAGQNTLSFGNLAQQSPPAHQPPAFNTSPSFSGWRG